MGRWRTNDISAGNSFRPFDLLIPTCFFRMCISIRAVGKKARIVTMDDIINSMLREQLVHKLLIDFVWCTHNQFIHPLHWPYHRHPTTHLLPIRSNPMITTLYSQKWPPRKLNLRKKPQKAASTQNWSGAHRIFLWNGKGQWSRANLWSYGSAALWLTFHPWTWQADLC